MATITSTTSGDWNTGATWVGGVKPANGDSAVIASGHTVTLDADLITDGIALAALTITGILDCKTTGGPYSIKMDGVSGHNITGAGQLKAGTSGTPLPFATKFVIDLGASSVINLASDLQCLLYCTQPTYPFVRLTAQKVATDTVLDVDSDVTADQWTVGDPLVIVNINKGNDHQAVGTNPRTLAAKSSTTITLSAGGLDSTNIIGAYVFLATRNIEIQQTSNGGFISGVPPTYLTRFSEFRCSIRQTGAAKSGRLGGGYAVFSGVISGLDYASNAGHQTISGISVGGNYGQVGGYSLIVSGIMGGYTTGIHSNEGWLLTGSIIGCASAITGGPGTGTATATIDGCANGLGANFTEFAGTVRNCTTGIVAPCILRGASFSANTADIALAAAGRAQVIGYGATLGSTIPVLNYAYITLRVGWQRVCIYDADGLAGRIKSWMPAGKIEPDTGTLPPSTSYTLTHKFAWSIDNSTPLFVDIPIYVEARTTTITVSIKKSANGMTETPSAQIIDPNQEIFSAGSVLTSATMADDTNWQTLTLSYTAAYARQLILRVRGRNASGNLWFNFAVSSGGGIIRVGMNGGLVG